MAADEQRSDVTRGQALRGDWYRNIDGRGFGLVVLVRGEATSWFDGRVKGIKQLGEQSTKARDTSRRWVFERKEGWPDPDP